LLNQTKILFLKKSRFRLSLVWAGGVDCLAHSRVMAIPRFAICADAQQQKRSSLSVKRQSV